MPLSFLPNRLLATCFSLTSTWASATGSGPGLPQGPHAVGFKVVRQVDRTREFLRRVDPITGEAVTADRSRPVQTLLWYPATAPGAPLRYADYLATRLSEITFTLTPEQLEAGRARQAATLARRRGAEGPQAFERRVVATADAPPAPGPFPLVLYAPGVGGSADENADLFEHLASHGYVVVASTNLGASDKTVEESLVGVEPQVRDLQFLMGYASTLPSVDPGRIAAMGWSWGGMANVFAAARDERIGALVSLDGTREPALTRQIDVRRLTAPWLYLSRSPDTIPQIHRSGIDTTFSLLNEARHAEVTQVILYPLQHADFTSARLHEASPAAYGEYTREEVGRAYAVAARLIRAFLDAHLKGDAQAKALLAQDPRDLGADPHSVRIERSPAPLPPATRSQLAGELARRGFAQAEATYQALRQRDRTFTLAPEELQGWGYALLGKGRPGDAVEIFKLWTRLHPEDWNAFDSLGEAQEALGQHAAAHASYARSLALNPGNRNAEARLKVLAEAAPRGMRKPSSR